MLQPSWTPGLGTASPAHVPSVGSSPFPSPGSVSYHRLSSLRTPPSLLLPCVTLAYTHTFSSCVFPLCLSHAMDLTESHPTAAPSPLSFYPQPPWPLPSLHCRLSQHTCYSSPSIPFNRSLFYIPGRVNMLLTSSFSNIRLAPTSSHLALRPLLFSNSHGLHHYLIKHSTDEDKGCHFHSPMGHLGNLPQVSRQASHPNSEWLLD